MVSKEKKKSKKKELQEMSIEHQEKYNPQSSNKNDATNETLNVSVKEQSEEKVKQINKSPFSLDSYSRSKSPFTSSASMVNRSKSPIIHKQNNALKASTQSKQNIISTLYPSSVNSYSNSSHLYNNNSIKRTKKKVLKKDKSIKNCNKD